MSIVVRRNFFSEQVDYFLVVDDVALKHGVHLRFDGAPLDVHHSHVVDLAGAVDTCVGLQVRLDTVAWSIPNDCVGVSHTGMPLIA